MIYMGRRRWTRCFHWLDLGHAWKLKTVKNPPPSQADRPQGLNCLAFDVQMFCYPFPSWVGLLTITGTLAARLPTFLLRRHHPHTGCKHVYIYVTTMWEERGWWQVAAIGRDLLRCHESSLGKHVCTYILRSSSGARPGADSSAVGRTRKKRLLSVSSSSWEPKNDTPEKN